MKRIYLLATAALALVSCDKNDENMVSSREVAHICATIGESLPTRASDNSWAERDKIGVTATVNGTQKHTNMLYETTNGDGEFSGNTIYFYNPMVLTAYYPFRGEEGTAPGIIAVDTRSGNQTAANQHGIDFLWDTQSTIHVVDNVPEIHFNFAHKMSKLTLTFIKGNAGMDVNKIVSYRIEGLVLDGTFDPATGRCVATGDPESLTITLPEGTVESSLILLPQKLDAANVTLHIEAREVEGAPLQHYSCSLSFADNELKEGNNYQYKVKVSKAGLVVNQSAIDDWTTVQPEEGEEPTANSADEIDI